ncbi:HutD/Ves family protein [Sphingomonas sanxanigenens]|uniref:HutD-family protein n=1 Tax=Sphingomonas sanxanigenens DSM 19645 = NX02 TaxID=1123269 RepID=W0AGG3_9SPHN|nr:HutD family protein [Sphingomonas sanxanigenens]AHE54745.1 hypothetical protein NX02_15310 [Sphingomonas sanxanigenens DSM 19645 = NX02]
MVRLLPAADRVAKPWKNGGGTTSDLLFFPPDAGMEDFGWRLSIADVAAAGPFSAFADVDRSLSVLEGDLELAVAGDAPVRLTPEAGAFSFAGDAPAHGRPVGGAVRDLNLMVRRGAWRGRVDRVTDFPAAIAAGDAAALVVLATGETTVDAGGAAYAMAPLDALLVERPEAILIAAVAAVHIIRIWPG